MLHPILPAILASLTPLLGLEEAAEPLDPVEAAPGIFTVGLSDRYGSANIGWIVFADHVTLVGAPHPDLAERIIDIAAGRTGKPVRRAILTHLRQGERDAARVLAGRGIAILASRDAVESLRASPGFPASASVTAVSGQVDLTDGKTEASVIELGHSAGTGDLAVLARGAEVLFTGEACVNGPRAQLPGSATARWAAALRRLRGLRPRLVIPGFGSSGGPEILERNERFLAEIRRQVSHLVARGLPREEIRRGVRIEPEWMVWMPYDTPVAADIDHVIGELSVPAAPFLNDPFPAGDPAPRALALIGDGPHEPGHLEEGLRPAFEKAGVAVRFCVDPRGLTAENLKAVRLLVILRDGLTWPEGQEKPPRMWMTPEQERAVVAFVEAGGGFLALHNSTGLYPDGGPYLGLLGGTYQGHGPLERFQVSVIDPAHPITRGVSGYEVADEQHTPAPDLKKVHLILESRSRSGIKGHAGWVHEAGKGRVAYLANGHTREALGNGMYQLLMRNAMRWCLGER